MKKLRYFIKSYVIGATGIIEIHNPAQRNALSSEVLQELNESLEEYGLNNSIKSILITGDGENFASGGNIIEYMKYSLQSAYLQNIVSNFDKLSSISKPIIAGIHGYALGGGFQLALKCDILIAASSARFGHPEMSIAAIPGVGSTQFLPRILGKSKSMSAILTGELLTAEEAYQTGIVSQVVEHNELIGKCLELCERVNRNSQTANIQCKERVLLGY